MIKVCGYSDDIVVIERGQDPIEEIDCFDEEVTVWFSDGTVIKVGYGKSGAGIWWIKKVEDGTAESRLTLCNDEDDLVYSDIFEIDAEVVNYCVGPVNEDVQTLKGLFRELKKKYAFAHIDKAYKEIFNEG